MNWPFRTNFEIVAIGVSAGGLEALSLLVPCIPAAFPLAVVVIQHYRDGDDDFLAEHLGRRASTAVRVAKDKEPIQPGTVYIAPADYHLLVERDGTFSLSMDAPVHYCRPSIDVLFESVAATYGNRAIGIVLTGANGDGSTGLKHIRNRGGLAFVQEPATAKWPYMPQEAIRVAQADRVLNLDEIGRLLAQYPADKATRTMSLAATDV